MAERTHLCNARHEIFMRHFCGFSPQRKHASFDADGFQLSTWETRTRQIKLRTEPSCADGARTDNNKPTDR
jgi:hypothetical protein